RQAEAFAHEPDFGRTDGPQRTPDRERSRSGRSNNDPGACAREKAEDIKDAAHRFGPSLDHRKSAHFSGPFDGKVHSFGRDERSGSGGSGGDDLPFRILSVRLSSDPPRPGRERATRVAASLRRACRRQLERCRWRLAWPQPVDLAWKTALPPASGATTK